MSILQLLASPQLKLCRTVSCSNATVLMQRIHKLRICLNDVIIHKVDFSLFIRVKCTRCLKNTPRTTWIVRITFWTRPLQYHSTYSSGCGDKRGLEVTPPWLSHRYLQSTVRCHSQWRIQTFSLGRATIGAEGAEWGRRSGRGCPPPHWGVVLGGGYAPSAANFFNLLF